MIEYLKELQKTEDNCTLDGIVDFIFEHFNSKLRDGEFIYLNEVLKEMDPNRFNMQTCHSTLTAACWGKKELAVGITIFAERLKKRLENKIVWINIILEEIK